MIRIYDISYFNSSIIIIAGNMKSNSSRVTCHACGKFGHIAKECPEKNGRQNGRSNDMKIRNDVHVKSVYVRHNRTAYQRVAPNKHPIPQPETSNKLPMPQPETSNKHPIPQPETSNKLPMPQPETSNKLPMPQPVTPRTPQPKNAPKQPVTPAASKVTPKKQQEPVKLPLSPLPAQQNHTNKQQKQHKPNSNNNKQRRTLAKGKHIDNFGKVHTKLFKTFAPLSRLLR